MYIRSAIHALIQAINIFELYFQAVSRTRTAIRSLAESEAQLAASEKPSGQNVKRGLGGHLAVNRSIKLDRPNQPLIQADRGDHATRNLGCCRWLGLAVARFTFASPEGTCVVK